jgi:tryptophanyl-tRNA synthetase
MLEANARLTVADRDRLLGWLEGAGFRSCRSPRRCSPRRRRCRVGRKEDVQVLRQYHRLREDTDSVVKKLKAMQTDPARVRRTDPGDPEKCPGMGSAQDLFKRRDQGLGAERVPHAAIGCLECKAPLIEKVVEEISTITKRAQEFEENPDLVRGIIAEGCERARAAARDTLDAVRQAMAMNYR